jgi:hypothetical protein
LSERGHDLFTSPEEVVMAEFNEIRRFQTAKQAFVAAVLALGVLNVVLTIVTLTQM